jgi:quercetin dioxygenase-like cupin family protein
VKLRLVLGLVAALAAGQALAQAPPLVQREIKTRMDIEGGKREVVLGRVDIAPGAAVEPHVHPGQEMGYIVTGQLTLKVRGQPDRHMVPGQTYQIAAGVPHEAIADADSRGGVSISAVWVLDKGKPMSSPPP